MIICSCTGATADEVVEAIQTGAATAEDVSDRCGAGSRCGGCLVLVERQLFLAMRQQRAMAGSAA
jgi:bacterioferritin-associated ferredoxin